MLSSVNSQWVLVWSARGCALAAVCVAAFAAWRMRPAEDLPGFVSAPLPQFEAAPHIAAENWNVFAPSRAATSVAGEAEGKVQRFRLAGTFFAMGDGQAERRRAILDDTQSKQQSIVGQGEDIAGWTVQEVGSEHAVLVRGAEREVLKRGAGELKAVVAPVLAAAGNVPLSKDESVLEETAFGKRVGETRWVLSRAAVMDYYQGLLDNPERIAALYMSLKPEYRGEDISGYRLNQEGEQDFFKAMGLKEGDVVRKVNAMNMTSQARAEYFISEFVKNRLNAVVIDIEREGKPQKMIYLAR